MFYGAHISGAVDRINDWLEEVANATQSTRPGGRAGSVPPMAVFGSNGSGKSHLLSWLNRAANEDPKTSVLRRGLADHAQGRLTLSGLLLQHLPLPPSQSDMPSSLPLLDRILDDISDADEVLRTAALNLLPSGSPIATPLRLLIEKKKLRDAKHRMWFSRWIRREHTSPAQLAKLGLSGKLSEEGQAIQAISDILRLARHFGILEVWMLLIDQLEDLWTTGTTPTRRARFLTDLRGLVDQALSGAPVAVLMAWNTRTARSSYGRSGDIDELIQRDYNALWERIGKPARLDGMKDEDVWPFALAYLRDAGVDGARDSRPERNKLFADMKAAVPRVLKRLESEAVAQSGYRHLPRAVLREWRTECETIAAT